MRVPMSWLREMVALPAAVTTQQIADALTRVGLQVERIEVTGAEVSGPVVVGYGLLVLLGRAGPVRGAPLVSRERPGLVIVGRRCAAEQAVGLLDRVGHAQGTPCTGPLPVRGRTLGWVRRRTG